MKTRTRNTLSNSVALAIALVAAGCGSHADDGSASGDGKITSNDGTALELRFQGQVLAPRGDPARQSVVAQLQYVQGTLTTAHSANGQVGLVTLADVVVEDAPGDKSRIRYSAALPETLRPTGNSM